MERRVADSPVTLFLYRTPRKRRYFELLAEHAEGATPVRVLAYRRLPPSGRDPRHAPSPAELAALVRDAQAQWFNARTSRRARVLKALSEPLLRSHVARLYRRLHAHLERTRPALVVLWNGCKYQDKVLRAANRRLGVPVCYFENGLLPGCTTLDPRGINAENSVPRDRGFYAALPRDHALPGRLAGRAYARERESAERLPERYLLVPFQLDRDSQILDNSPWVRSMAQLFDVCREALERAADPSLCLVFREHPSARSGHGRLRELAAGNPRLIFDSSPDLQGVIDGAEAVLTVNSTVGIDALQRHRRVITLGEACYDIEGLTRHAADVDELARVIDSLPRWRLDVELTDRFLYYLRHHYAIEGDWRRPDAAHYRAVGQRLTAFLSGGEWGVPDRASPPERATRR